MTQSFVEKNRDGGAERRNGTYVMTRKKCNANGRMSEKLVKRGSSQNDETEGMASNLQRRHRLTRSMRLLIMLLMTFAFFVVELIFGYLSHSMALVADSFHMLSDVMALAIAFACLRIASRSSKNNTFGWVRAEVLGALVNGVFLLALCFSIFIESLTRLIEPREITQPLNVLIVGIIGFIINFIGIFMFHSHAHDHGDQDVSVQLQTQPGKRQTHVTIDGNESQHLMSSHQ
ncbi:unnamed protein product, partial [Thelazia callipaeda]|uniref:Zinc transporter n=1 Tax=Thelazia callipaeda TaxID=103827 RepID=A0A0N5CTH2_THECL